MVPRIHFPVILSSANVKHGTKINCKQTVNNVEYEKLAHSYGLTAQGFSVQVPGWRIPFVLHSICPACFHQLMQYLGGCLRDRAIGTDNFDKPIFQPAQISVRLYHVPAQAGEVCYQQKVNFSSVYRIRSCLVSIQKQPNKSERKHLKRVLQFTLAVFPKSATFIDPSKRALDDPAFWQNSKGVEFIAFNDLNICARKSGDGVGKIFSGVTSIHQNLLEHRQMIRYITIIVNHVDCSVPVGHIGSCYHDHVGQP